MKLWLVRHARPLIEPGVCYGATDLAADPQATLKAATGLAGWLPAALPVRCSPLLRCVQLARALHELRPEFGIYQKAVLDNARALAETLRERGLDIVSGGTDSHLFLVDLRPKNVTGKASEASLERAHITANKNAIPFDPAKPAITSGIRLGSPAATSRGFGVAEFREIGQMIDEVLVGLAASNDGANAAAEQAVGQRVRALCARFPIYPGR